MAIILKQMLKCDFCHNYKHTLCYNKPEGTKITFSKPADPKGTGACNNDEKKICNFMPSVKSSKKLQVISRLIIKPALYLIKFHFIVMKLKEGLCHHGDMIALSKHTHL